MNDYTLAIRNNLMRGIAEWTVEFRSSNRDGMWLNVAHATGMGQDMFVRANGHAVATLDIEGERQFIHSATCVRRLNQFGLSANWPAETVERRLR